MIRCEQCGAMNDRAQSVCGFCGRSLDDGDPVEVSERQDTAMDNALPLIIVLVILAFFILAVLMGFML